MKSLKLLALSGSLRQASYNTAALAALKIVAPDSVQIVHGNIGALPLFNPDREAEVIAPVVELKTQLDSANGLVIASPEYAHGISGPMKNALDWLVSGVEFPNKPIMLINTSPRACHAMAALREVLTTMSGNIVDAACVSIPLLSSELDAAGIAADPELSEVLTQGLTHFCNAIETGTIETGTIKT